MLRDIVKFPLEMQLLLTCAKVETSPQDEAAIRRILAGEIDWTLFARKALDHGLAGIAGHVLARVAPDLTPGEMLGAFRSILDQARSMNRSLLNELAGLIDALAKDGIAAIPFRGPALALQTYGDIGLRRFKDLDLFVRETDRVRALATLRRLDFKQPTAFTDSQRELIRRLQGREVLLSDAKSVALKLHTRLDAGMALDLDHEGLWSRATRAPVNGRSLPAFAPEDSLILLAVHGGRELWWNLRWVCDVAAFIRSQTNLDWRTAITRARAQGCLRLVALATALARRLFDANPPDAMAEAERAHPEIDRLADRIIARWLSADSAGPRSDGILSLDRLQLHDGILRQTRFVARSLFVPGPHHIASVSLPWAARFAYIPIKLAQDIVPRRGRRASRQAPRRAGRLQDAFAASALPLFMVPVPAAAKAKIRQLREARAEAKRALAQDPDKGAAWAKLGDALAGLKRFEQAIACYDKALALAPYNTSAWKRRAAAAHAIGEKDDLADTPRDPQDAGAWAVLAGRLFSTKRFAEAVEASARALAIDPKNIAALRVGIQSRLFACDWRRLDDDRRLISASARSGLSLTSPFFHRALSDSEAEHLLVARVNAKGWSRTEPLWRGERYRHDKIRIAYMSTDLRDHVVSDAIAGCFEHHDKTRFETYAISIGPNDHSAMRRRLEAAFDRFIDAQAMSDTRIAGLMRELEIDIVIDLNGNSGETRTGILARKPAPVQAHYLGFAGTMGTWFMDYVIADRIVIPEDQRVHYAEKVVYLPHTYMPNDATREISPRTPSRSEAGLPEHGFVFACHNQEYKLGPEIFDVWMRLLHAVDDSVLWLKFHNPSAMTNLWREANARGIAPERLIFAPRLPRAEDHLARLRLADLFLDTRPYNAHATTCDALWAGLPVLTCPGSTFPSRVAASVLHAIGLPELVTSSLAEYETMALALARDPAQLSSIKAKLARNRGVAPLFDTAGITRALESAYVTMWERQQSGKPPESFAIPG